MILEILHDPEATARIPVHEKRLPDFRLGGHQLDLKALAHPKRFHRFLGWGRWGVAGQGAAALVVLDDVGDLIVAGFGHIGTGLRFGGCRFL